jgi:hypothetical protein
LTDKIYEKSIKVLCLDHQSIRASSIGAATVVNTIHGNALQGIQQARSKMQQNAMDIVRANNVKEPNNSLDAARSLVELNQNKNAAQASMKVIKSENEMLGSILDVTA